jgi:myosin heavy subunit
LYPDDLAGMDGRAVEEEKVVNILDQRYRRGSFHTFVGNMLLIINPNQDIKIYDNVVRFLNLKFI